MGNQIRDTNKSVASGKYVSRTLLNTHFGVSSPLQPKRALLLPTSTTTAPVSSPQNIYPNSLSFFPFFSSRFHPFFSFFSHRVLINEMAARIKKRAQPSGSYVEKPYRSIELRASPLLLTYKQIVEDKELFHLADNDSILSGYRHLPGFDYAIYSLFFIHNETVNIYTHLSGFIACVAALFYSFNSPGTVGLAGGCEAAPLWPLQIFLSGALLCFLFSVLFHTFMPVSKSLGEALNVLDYAGISGLIFSSMVPPLYYAFTPRNPHLRNAYIFLSVTTNAVCVLLGSLTRFRTPSWRKFRAGAFIISGLSGVAPLLHHFVVAREREAHHSEIPMALGVFGRVLFMGAQYIIGAALYASRVPERYSPGSWDFFGSHSIFHVLVCTAVYTHFVTVRELWTWRYVLAGCGSA